MGVWAEVKAFCLAARDGTLEALIASKEKVRNILTFRINNDVGLCSLMIQGLIGKRS